MYVLGRSTQRNVCSMCVLRPYDRTIIYTYIRDANARICVQFTIFLLLLDIAWIFFSCSYILTSANSISVALIFSRSRAHIGCADVDFQHFDVFFARSHYFLEMPVSFTSGSLIRLRPRAHTEISVISYDTRSQT